MYIREFRIRNFMVHQDTAMKLSPLTVFVGPNGGGKSAFFDAMLNFSMLSRGNLRQAFGPYPYSYRATRYRGASDVSRIGYQAVISRTPDDEDRITYAIDYSQTAMRDDVPAFTIFSERVVKGPDGSVLFDRTDPEKYPLSVGLPLEEDRSLFSAIRQRQMFGQPVAADDLLLYCTQQISRFNKFRLDPTVLAQPCRLPEVASEASPAVGPRLGYHGEDLAATLYHLAETNSPALDTIREKVKGIDAAFAAFEFSTVGTDRIAFSASYADGRQSVPSVRLSSGMLGFIGLITLVATDSRPPVLMIEEPENGLTPQAVKAFYQAVRTLAHGTDPSLRSQVLISSHSPFVICEAWNGDDREFIHQVKVEAGRARIRSFSDVIAENKIVLAKEKRGDRTHLSLANAEEIMSGYLA
ncbi:MAG: AAA family ATPase [Gemmatimonadaceae bacterium]